MNDDPTARRTPWRKFSDAYGALLSWLLVITIAVLIANLAADVLTGVIDPRIRAAETGER